MLPPFIIEQIRQREELERRKQEERDRPRLELPLDVHQPARRPPEDEDEPERGVVILDFG